MIILCLVCFLLGKYVDGILHLEALALPRLGGRGDSGGQVDARTALEDGQTEQGTADDDAKAQGQAEETREAVAVLPDSVVANSHSLLSDPELLRVTKAMRTAIAPNTEGKDHMTVYPYQIISWHPRAAIFPHFLTSEECDHIGAIGRKRLAPSQLALKKGDDPTKQTDVRTR